MRKVFLEDLPRGRLNRGDRINWELSIGHKVKGVYKNIEFEVEIIKIDENDRDYIHIKYLDNPLFRIHTGNFRMCKMGKRLKFVHTNYKMIEEFMCLDNILQYISTTFLSCSIKDLILDSEWYAEGVYESINNIDSDWK